MNTNIKNLPDLDDGRPWARVPGCKCSEWRLAFVGCNCGRSPNPNFDSAGRFVGTPRNENGWTA